MNLNYPKKLIIFSLFFLGITSPVFSHNSINTKNNCGIGNSNLLAGSFGCAGECEAGKTCTDAFGSKYECCGQALKNSNCNWGLKGSCLNKCS